MTGNVDEFRAYRERMNDLILGSGNLTITRFFALDTRAYEPGALDVATKELLGLVASMVLRCDDWPRTTSSSKPSPSRSSWAARS
jgi:alkylhydroperoxidase/carboxymuconolactone decarboxylase family protein YurZ